VVKHFAKLSILALIINLNVSQTFLWITAQHFTSFSTLAKYIRVSQILRVYDPKGSYFAEGAGISPLTGAV